MLGDWLKPSLATLTRRYGRDRAVALIAEAREGFDFFGRFIADEGIDCNFVSCGGFTGVTTAARYEAMARETDELSRSIGLEADMVPKSEVRNEIGTDLYYGGRVTHRRAGLHPARYHAGLIARVRAAGVTVVGDCPVTALECNGSGFRVSTPQASLGAREVVVATNGYTGAVTPALGGGG